MLTNEERLLKLLEAEKLLRDVEFSYPMDSNVRKDLYLTVVSAFGIGSAIDRVKKSLGEDLKKEMEGVYLGYHVPTQCTHDFHGDGPVQVCKGCGEET